MPVERLFRLLAQPRRIGAGKQLGAMELWVSVGRSSRPSVGADGLGRPPPQEVFRQPRIPYNTLARQPICVEHAISWLESRRRPRPLLPRLLCASFSSSSRSYKRAPLPFVPTIRRLQSGDPLAACQHTARAHQAGLDLQAFVHRHGKGSPNLGIR